MTDQYFEMLQKAGANTKGILSEIRYEDEVINLLASSLLDWCRHDKYKAYGMAKELCNLMEEAMRSKDE